MTRIGGGAIGFALILAACGGSGDGADSTDPGATSAPIESTDTSVPNVTSSTPVAAPETTPPARSTTTSETKPAPPTTTPPPVQPPVLDLDAEQMVMFAPVPPRPADKPDFPTPDGSNDFFELFEHPERWEAALTSLGAFKLHGWMIKHYLTDAELVLIGEVLDRYEVPLIIEAEPLEPPDPNECDHTESFEGPYELDSLRRIRNLGLNIAAVSIEQPLHFAHLMTGPGACQYSLERVFDELVTWRAGLRRIYPDAMFGTIESVWDITTPADYERWLDGWEAASGEPFAFQHLDVNWQLPDWIDRSLAIEQVVDARGLPFGILYNGGVATTSGEFIAETMQRIVDFETAGGTPEHTVIQSWVDVPDQVLPVDDTSGFSHLLTRYASGQTTISAGADGDRVVGTITRSDGSPAAGVPVGATAAPPAGERRVYQISGTVPDGVTEALVVVRVNGEDAVVGDVTTEVFDVAITQDDGPNLLVNGSFDSGVDTWGMYDTNTGSAVIERLDGVAVLRLRASPDQEVWIDGAAFPIEGGAPVTLAVEAALDGDGEGGRIALIFLGADIEEGRLTLPLEPVPDVLGRVTTEADGSFVMQSPGLDVVEDTVTVFTPGDVTTWPAGIRLPGSPPG